MGRPRSPLISREAATSAALDVIDETGLDNFSLGLVAKRMNVKAPSLYYHFTDKAEILAEVARFILLDTGYDESAEGTWEERTIELCVETRRALLKHPQAAALILQFFPRHLLLDSYEHAVAGYPQTRSLHMVILEGIEKLTFGDALFEAAARAKGVPAMPAIDPEKYPNLAQSVAANTMNDEQVFTEALRMFFAGVRVRTAELQD
ncbi:MAG: helix-turn-helix transcriptional regulator [Sphingomonadales bacterium]|nr:helix-turn-helix transcriptional regulator [Sphingomonadales bacterium]